MDTLDNKNESTYQKKSVPAVISLIFGLASLIFMRAFCSIISSIFAIIGLRNVKKYNTSGKTEATIDLVLSILGFIRTSIVLFSLLYTCNFVCNTMVPWFKSDELDYYSRDISREIGRLYTNDYQLHFYTSPPEFEPYLGTRIVLTEEEFAKLPESLQKALSVNLSYVHCPKPFYPLIGSRYYAIELYEDTYKLFVITEKGDWQTGGGGPTLYS